jgi:Phage tail tube protein
MATGRGFQSILAVKAESAWGTAVACDAKLPFISEDLTETFSHLPNEMLTGAGARARSFQGARAVQGGFVAYWTYALAQPVLKAFFGLHTVNASADDSYDMQETLDNDSMTVAIEKSVSVHEYAGFKINELMLSGSPTDGVRIAANGFAKSRSISSSTNTTNTLAALADPTNFVQFYNLVLRIGDTVDALAGGDAISVASFELSLTRNLEPALVNSQLPLEALENGRRESTLTLEIPRYTADTFLSWHASHTLLQCDMVFTSSALVKTIRMPQLTVVSVPANISGPGLVPLTVTLALANNLSNDNANTGFTFDPEIRILEADGS